MNQEVKRGVGRPRANNKQTSNPARDEILQASAALFSEFGYKGTSTRKIAEKVGIRQPSLFHHFGKKEDILAALVQEGAVKIIEYVNNLDKLADPAVQLYKLMVFDAFYLMTEPYQINKLMSLPEVRQGHFKSVIEKNRAIVVEGYRSLIALGLAQNEFFVDDIEVTTNTILGMGESLWSWYDRNNGESPETIAPKIADMGLRSILIDCTKLDNIRNTCQLEFLKEGKINTPS